MSLIGYYTTSYAKLVEVFGSPSESDGYKVSTEWGLTTDDGVSFSLYDYKETNLYDEDLPSVEEFRSLSSFGWHIGGWNGLESIKLYLDKKLK